MARRTMSFQITQRHRRKDSQIRMHMEGGGAASKLDEVWTEIDMMLTPRFLVMTLQRFRCATTRVCDSLVQLEHGLIEFRSARADIKSTCNKSEPIQANTSSTSIWCLRAASLISRRST